MQATDFSRGSARSSSAPWPLWGRRGVRAGDERSEELQFPPVASVRAGKLEDRRNLPEAFVIHQEPERLLPEFSFPDVFVSIRTRPQIAFRIVQMKRADARQPDRFLYFLEEFFISLPRPEVVARGECVARVDAYGKALRMRTSLYDLGELIKGVADDAPLAGGDLEDRKDVRRGRVIEGAVQARGDRLETVGLPFPEVGARMEDDVPDAKDLGAIQLLDERSSAVAQPVLLGRAEVDQIVRMDDRAGQSVCFQVFLERHGLLGRDRLRLAQHPRAPREDLDRLAADRPPPRRSHGDALCNRDVG